LSREIFQELTEEPRRAGHSRVPAPWLLLLGRGGCRKYPEQKKLGWVTLKSLGGTNARLGHPPAGDYEVVVSIFYL